MRKIAALGLIALTMGACFSKGPGPCYDCQLFETIQNGASSTSSSAYIEKCDSLAVVTFIHDNTSTVVTQVGTGYRVVTRSASCTRQ